MNVKATAGCIVDNEKDQILLIKRNTPPFKDKWCVPGGHIDFGETAKEAVTREVKEETGLDIKPVFLKYIDEIHTDIDWHAVVILFKAKTKSQPFHFDKNEIKEAKWFDIEDVKKLDLAFHYNEVIKEL